MLFHGSHSNLNVVIESNIAYAEKSIVLFFILHFRLWKNLQNHFLDRTILWKNSLPEKK